MHEIRGTNFWDTPKLYFYMKFQEDVYFSIEYMYSDFSNWHALFVVVVVFLIIFYSRCNMEWDTACRPTDGPF